MNLFADVWFTHCVNCSAWQPTYPSAPSPAAGLGCHHKRDTGTVYKIIIRMYNGFFSTAIFGCSGSFVYLVGHMWDNRFCTGFLKCLLSLQLCNEVRIKWHAILLLLPHHWQEFCMVGTLFSQSFSFPALSPLLNVTSEDQFLFLNHGVSFLYCC